MPDYGHACMKVMRTEIHDDQDMACTACFILLFTGQSANTREILALEELQTRATTSADVA